MKKNLGRNIQGQVLILIVVEERIGLYIQFYGPRAAFGVLILIVVEERIG